MLYSVHTNLYVIVIVMNIVHCRQSIQWDVDVEYE